MKIPRVGLVQEFKEFAIKGSVVDLAVGIIIGAAFTKIVNSLVSDIIMPPVGLLVSNVDFSQLHVTLREARLDPVGKVLAPAVTLNYGSFINGVIAFLIVAFTVFLLVKGINMLRRKEAAAPAAPAAQAAPPALAPDLQLLTEIRDLLKGR